MATGGLGGWMSQMIQDKDDIDNHTFSLDEYLRSFHKSFNLKAAKTYMVNQKYCGSVIEANTQNQQSWISFPISFCFGGKEKKECQDDLQQLNLKMPFPCCER